MSLLKSSVGRKIFMAVSGMSLVMFVIVHFLGNSTIFFGPDWINSYAQHLHDLGPFVWIFRGFMLAMLLIHVFFGVVLTLENWAANPGKYAVSANLKASFSSRMMIWTGLSLLAFIIFHLLHFTVRVLPGVIQITDAQGRFDVHSMVVAGFHNAPLSGVYILAMVVLFLHLSHGIQSLFQTVGLNNDRSMPVFNALGKVVALLLLLGYSAIPILTIAWIIS